MNPDRPAPTRQAWAMLAASTLAQAAAAVTQHGAAFLIPRLHADGLSLAGAGLLAACPTIGVMLTLVPWGFFVDRYGERRALLIGLLGTAAAGCSASALAGDHLAFGVALVVAGGFAASTNAASGRVVTGWFPPHRRGTAMGIRQMAQPVGVGIAAVGIALLAGRGVGQAWLLAAGMTALAALVVGLVVLDPPRPERTVERAANPYRRDRFLVRIHGVSMLLVVPQFVVWTFALAWLVQGLDWSAGAAGALVGVSQVVGALGRIAVGALSDRVGSRMRPLVWVAVAAGGTMLLLGLLAELEWWPAAAVLVIATAVTVADNGLAFTAVAERAGPFWSGRALGIQNTGQFLTASAVPPVAGLMIGHWGYPAVFALAAVFPVVAVGLVPWRGERSLR